MAKPTNPLRLTWLAIVLGLAVSLTSLLLFMHIADAVFVRKAVAQFDWQVMAAIQGALRGPVANRLMVLISWFGSFPAYLLFCLAAAVRLWRRGRRREATALLICLGGAHFLNLGLKIFYQRPRPDIFPLVTAGGYSFPSGHAMVSLPFYGFLTYLAPTLSAYRRRVLAGPAALLVAAIGVSRVYLGVHWPSDVLAGFAAGTVWLASCVASLTVGDWRRKRRGAGSHRK